MKYCLTCGKEIPKNINYSWKYYKTQKFCSMECRNNNKEWIGIARQRILKMNKSKNPPRKKRTGRWVKCDYCGNSVYIRRHQFKEEHHYCSTKCMGLAMRGKEPVNKGISKYNISEKEARILFDEFIKSKINIQEFARLKHLRSQNLSKLFKKYFPDELELNTERLKTKMGTYHKGRKFEYRVRNFFRELGYFVIRSAASKTPVDLIAFKKGELLFIQCKINPSGIKRKEKDELFELANSINAKPVFAYKLKHKLVFQEIVERGKIKLLPTKK